MPKALNWSYTVNIWHSNPDYTDLAGKPKEQTVIRDSAEERLFFKPNLAFRSQGEKWCKFGLKKQWNKRFKAISASIYDITLKRQRKWSKNCFCLFNQRMHNSVAIQWSVFLSFQFQISSVNQTLISTLATCSKIASVFKIASANVCKPCWSYLTITYWMPKV